MVDHPPLRTLDAAQLREWVTQLMAQTRHQQARIDQLTHEMAILRRLKFAAQSEKFPAAQASLLDETLDADLAALEAELAAHSPAAEAAPAPRPQSAPRRQPLPAALPRIDQHHEPVSTTCSCGCALARIGEDVAEKLGYTPGVFTVKPHVRGKWVCRHCQTLVQAPVPAHVIDKGLADTGLLAHVMVAKFADHLPLYRQEAIFGRAGLPIARSTLAQWVGTCGVALQPLADALKAAILGCGVLHADETPVAMLAPTTGKTHRATLSGATPPVLGRRSTRWCMTLPPAVPGATPRRFSATPRGPTMPGVAP